MDYQQFLKFEMARAQATASNKAAQVPEGWHRHKCPNNNCGLVWMHSDDCFGSESDHRCMKCGTFQWAKYFGSCKAKLKRVLKKASVACKSICLI